MAVTRFLLQLEYDGTGFCGWQRQKNAPSIQQELEQAASMLEGSHIRITAAGRTDAGVHARGQAAHADFNRRISEHKLRDALNALLRPQPICILKATTVHANFHARYHATTRHYLYKITDRRARPVLDKNRLWSMPCGLNANSMAKAAQTLVGHHDFSSFRDSQCCADSPMRTLDDISVIRKNTEIHICCSAQSFLHRQVRSMVGSLVEIGRGRWPPEKMRAILKSTNRAACGPVAPAHGLYLIRVDYPPEITGELPSQVK